ncbi:MAG: hypothetical protein HY590_01790 [Candidatus Omnitrophica bacterium]|nr:hypothetical protein [Candidatus Omnitrophota bacterium]
MKRTVVFMMVLVWLFVPTTTFAQPKGKGKGHAGTRPSAAERAGEEVGRSVIREVADELAGEPESPGGMPPGLSKKDKLPPGLEKQGKTPPGWEKGRKEGWDGAAPNEEGSAVRRLIRGIFRRSGK